MKSTKNTILLSELIGMFEMSINKTPKVPNHDKLVNLLPQMKQMLSRGDMRIPCKDLLTVLNGK